MQLLIVAIVEFLLTSGHVPPDSEQLLLWLMLNQIWLNEVYLQ